MEEYKRFTISLPPKLFEELEAFRNKIGISRSNFIKKSIQSFIIQEENIPKTTGDVAGCITMILSHEHIKQVENENHNHIHIHDHDDDEFHEHNYDSHPLYANVQQADTLLSRDIQHHFGDVIISTMHIHLEFEKCLEILAVLGPYERVNKLKQNLQKLKSVLSIGLFVVDKSIEEK